VATNPVCTSQGCPSVVSDVARSTRGGPGRIDKEGIDSGSSLLSAVSTRGQCPVLRNSFLKKRQKPVS
jgi:hypothetical protein